MTSDAGEAHDLTLDVLGDLTGPGHTSDSLGRTAWDRLAASDLTLVSLPEGPGGSGGTLIDAAGVLSATARAGLSLPLPETTWLAGWLATSAGQQVPSGPATVARAGGGLRAERTIDGWHLTGELTDVRWAQQVATAYVVLPEQATCVVVPTAAAGDDVSVGVPTGALTLDVIGSSFDLPGAPEVVLLELELRLALARAVQIAGAGAAALDLAVRYAGQREQFGRPLARNQVIQHHLARIAAHCHGASTATHAAVAAYEEHGTAAATAVRSAKATASEAVEEVTALAHQVIGAIGTTLEHDLHRRTMSLWAWRDDAGDEFEQGERLAEAALSGGADVWSFLAPDPGVTR
jgi:acyl-CoA dehydrogenase